jgi:hypothetical protein
MPDWLQHASRAAEMGFNWLYINSILYPGFSGSLYAIKHHYRINPDFLPPCTETDGVDMLAQTLQAFKDTMSVEKSSALSPGTPMTPKR